MNLIWARRSKEFDVDTHICVHHSLTHRDWLDRAIDSITSQPTNVVLVYGTEPLQAKRLRAMEESRSPWHAILDDDDYVVGNPYPALLRAVSSGGVCGAYTDREVVRPDGSRKVVSLGPWNLRKQALTIGMVTHLMLFNRKLALDKSEAYLASKTLESPYLAGLLAASGLPWVNIPEVGYSHNVHANSRSRGSTPEDRRWLTSSLWGYLKPLMSPTPSTLMKAPSLREKAKDWADEDTGCVGCNRVRRIIRKVL